MEKIRQGCNELHLPSGHTVKVDATDYKDLIKYRWNADGTRGRGLVYVKRQTKMVNGKRTKVYLHRHIMKPEKGECVDHINGDTLDNRRSNLRVCTHIENIQNQRLRSNNTSMAKGVRFKHDKDKWQAYITLNKKWKHIGYFETFQKAVEARMAVELENGWIQR